VILRATDVKDLAGNSQAEAMLTPGQETAHRTLPIPHLESGCGNDRSQAVYAGDQYQGLYLRSKEPLAQRFKREYKPVARGVLAKVHGPVSLLPERTELDCEGAE
jgi:hypothetical protein